jgi:hypothetical protein
MGVPLICHTLNDYLFEIDRGMNVLNLQDEFPEQYLERGRGI